MTSSSFGLDTRAYSWCNLGPLSEEGASIAEDHGQGTGVIMYKGTVNLKGIYRPASGTVVKLAYSDGQTWIAQLPLRLRVLSVFSNPVTDRTSVSVGCDFSLYENRKPPVTIKNDEENTNVPEVYKRIATPPLTAEWLAFKILETLQLSYVGKIPLKNRYIKEDFDMSSGYVDVLSKLCQSEGCVCYINTEGKVEFLSKDRELQSGFLLNQNDLIDINPINVGDLPGDAVYGRYTTLSLKRPIDDIVYTGNPVLDDEADEDRETDRKIRDWEYEEITGQRERIAHDWTKYNVVPNVDENGNPIPIKIKDSFNYDVCNPGNYPADSLPEGSYVKDGRLYEPSKKVCSTPERNVITFIPSQQTFRKFDIYDRLVFSQAIKTDAYGVVITTNNYTYNNQPPPNSGSYLAVLTQDDFLEYNQPVQEIVIEEKSIGPICMSLGLEQPYGFFASLAGVTFVSKKTIITNMVTGDATKTITRNFVPFVQTFAGSEVISRIRDRLKPYDQISRLPGSEFINYAIQLIESGSESRLSIGRASKVQKRPNKTERTTKEAKKKEAKKKKDLDVKENTLIAWAVGSAASQTAIELSPPYTPDDYIVYSNFAAIKKEIAFSFVGSSLGTVSGGISVAVDSPSTGSGSYNPYTPYYFAVIPSNAAQKVIQYGRLENRYLFGHRNGIGIQVLPEMLPSKPLSVFYIRMKGCTAAFLVNGRTWTLDPSGVTVTSDALFWGAIDGNAADAWFPLPPGNPTLPAPVTTAIGSNPVPCNAIPIPSGFDFVNPDLNTLFGSLPSNVDAVPPALIAPTIIIKPYHETVYCVAGGGGGAIVNSQFWIAQPAASYLAGGGGGAIAVAISQGLGAAWTSASVFNAGAGDDGLGGGGGGGGATGSGAAWTSASVFNAGAGSEESDPQFSTVSLLIHGGTYTSSTNTTTIVDSSSNAVSIANNYSTLSTFSIGTAFGNSIFFNGFSSYLSIPQSNLFLFDADFTLELQYYEQVNNDYSTVLELGDYQTGIMIRHGSGQNDQGVWVKNTRLFDSSTSAPYLGEFNQWNYLMIVRSGNTVTAKINNTTINSATIAGTIGASSGQQFYVGDSTHAPGRNFYGFIDELRISKFARTNTTTPTKPFPNA